MRLLTYRDDGELTITADFVDGDIIPPYAILSHTWGADVDEVSFEDLASKAAKDKPGYKKIRFCREQTQKDNLQYFWIDTCCINKADKAEFSHAIRSMFRFYRNAERCYVYLLDVSSASFEASGEGNPPLWELDFRKSRWFTRGWTLQELLAPRTVEFFSREQRKLGDKISLKSQIYAITSIPYEVLEGAPLSQFSVNERLRWKEHRETKRDEDGAYSLLGIFDVDLAPIYGEGAVGAFRRLMDEIHKIERCIQDVYSTDPRNDKKRIEFMKGGLIKDSYCWILDNIYFQQWHSNPQSQLLWIKGDPGKGKTMLLCGIIDELQKSTKTNLVSYFFCQATDSRINTATAVLRGLLFLLLSQQPSLVSYVRKKYDHAGKTMFEDTNAWFALTEIFTDILRDPSLNTTSTYMIIDALDECVTDMSKLLDFIKSHSSMSFRVKWIVSSRNWPEIEEQLRQAGHKVRLSLELNAESVSMAVQTFVKQKVSQLAQQKKYDSQIQDAVMEHLTLNANDTFLWVALVVQNLEATAKRNVLKKLNSFPPGLDSLYKQMMQQISNSDDAELCNQVLSTMALVYRPITLRELVTLVDQLEEIDDDKELRDIVGLCGSFLTLREDTVYFVHQSAKDFLLSQASEEVFPSGVTYIHRTIVSRSLEIMSRTLHRDMYDLKVPGYPIDNIKPPDPDPLAPSSYSCIYWIDHLCDSYVVPLESPSDDLQDNGAIDVFLREKYLYWLESLSLCNSVPKGVVSIGRLQALIKGRGDTTLFTNLIYDAYRFIMHHKAAIESSPLQVYVSALIFSPKKSLVRVLFQHEEPEWINIMPAMGDGWGACLQTLEGHSGWVNSVAFSPDSKQLASASDDSTVKIWNANSGECVQTLKACTDMVKSIAFSPNSAQLASTSDDSRIKIWDLHSGEQVQALEGHSRRVNSVAFSPDSKQLASASDDWTVKIWDTHSSECVQTLKGHSSMVNSVAFSPNSTRLASASDDWTVMVWGVHSGECVQTLEGHIDMVRSVVFSPNSAKLASSSKDLTIKIWDAYSGECAQTLRDHSRTVNSVAFSSDSIWLASASMDSTVKIWDVNNGECVRTLEGHSDWVNSVAFSLDSTQLASASDDNTVKIWDAHKGKCVQIHGGHSDRVNSVAFSPDLTWLASASDDRTVKIWDAHSGECVQTLEGHIDWVKSVTFSPDLTLLASASNDNMVRIWDAHTGECLQTLKGHINTVNSVAFSADSTRLASASDDRTVKIWDTHSGQCLKKIEGHRRMVNSVAFSPDLTHLASASDDLTVKIWDIHSGKCVQTLKGHMDWVSFVAFSPDSTRVVSAADDNTVKIWDVHLNECILTLKSNQPVYQISFDDIGSYLFTHVGAVAIDASLLLSDAALIESQYARYNRTALSSDGAWITYSSENVVWLPTEYRPGCLTIHGKTIGIGVGSGKVWICTIKL